MRRAILRTSLALLVPAIIFQLIFAPAFLYADVFPHWGGGLGTSTANALYLRLDGTNSPLTGAIFSATATTDTLILQTSDNNTTKRLLKFNNLTPTEIAAVTADGRFLAAAGTASLPAFGWLADEDGSGSGWYRNSTNTMSLTLNGAEKLRFSNPSLFTIFDFVTNSTGQMGFGSASTLASALDTIATRRAAANWNFGAADVNGSPVNQKLTSQGAVTGTDLHGGNLEIAPGPGTGAGAGAQLALDRYLMLATGTTQQSTAHGYVVCQTKTLSNTSATTTTIATVGLASNTAAGLAAWITVTASDGTNFDSETQSLNVSYVNKAGTITVGTAAITASTAANNSGSATIGATVTGATPTISLKVTPVFTTIVPTTVTVYTEIMNHGAGAVTCL